MSASRRAKMNRTNGSARCRHHHNSILKLGRRDKRKADLVLYLKIRRSVLYKRGRRGRVQR
jgi:hypothetical protein